MSEHLEEQEILPLLYEAKPTKTYALHPTFTSEELAYLNEALNEKEASQKRQKGQNERSSVDLTESIKSKLAQLGAEESPNE